MCRQLYTFAKIGTDITVNVSATSTPEAWDLAGTRGVDETWSLIGIWPSDKLNDPILEPGMRVQVIRIGSLEHILAGNMRCDGIITRINTGYTLAGIPRPVFVRFDDRPGEWAYGFEELAWVGNS